MRSRLEGLANFGLETLSIGKNIMATLYCGELVNLTLTCSMHSLIIVVAFISFTAELEYVAADYLVRETGKRKLVPSCLPP